MIRPDEFSEAAPWPVTIDYLFPTSHPEAVEWFHPGDRMAVAKVPNCALLLHVTRTSQDGTPLVRLTVAPIAMGKYKIGKERSFTTTTPEELNPSATLPAFPDL